MESWYVVYCKPDCEQQAAENLIRQGYEVYRPTLPGRVKCGNTITEKQQSMFPRYIFIRRHDMEINSMSINYTRGVIKLIAFSGVNARISGLEIEEIRIREIQIKQTIGKEFSDGKEISKIRFNNFSSIPVDLFSQNEKKRIFCLMSMLESKSIPRRNDSMAHGCEVGAI